MEPNGSDPDWSPDGNLILFRSVPGRDQHGNLYTINADGSDLKQLTRYPAPKALFAGSFSPDGKWITYSGFTSGGPGVFVMRLDETGLRQVTKGLYDVDVDWGRAADAQMQATTKGAAGQRLFNAAVAVAIVAVEAAPPQIAKFMVVDSSTCVSGCRVVSEGAETHFTVS